MTTISSQRINKMYLSKVQSSKARKISFELSKQEFRELILSEYCAYTGIALTIAKEGSVRQEATDVTLERVDCDKGYTMGNTIAVCHAANSAKNVFDSMLRADGLLLLRRMAKAVEKLESKVVEKKNHNFVQRVVLWVNKRAGL